MAMAVPTAPVPGAGDLKNCMRRKRPTGVPVGFIGELIALRWHHISFELRQATVVQSIVRNHAGDCKTEASRKPVPLHGVVIQELEKWKAQTVYSQPNDFLFPSISRNGTQPVQPDMVLRRHIRPALERAGVEGKRIGWHSFRHGLGTMLRQQGIDLKTAQEMLRHANSRITLEIYQQSVPAEKRDAQNKVMGIVLAANQPWQSNPSAPTKSA
jgi:integrase